MSLFVRKLWQKCTMRQVSNNFSYNLKSSLALSLDKPHKPLNSVTGPRLNLVQLHSTTYPQQVFWYIQTHFGMATKMKGCLFSFRKAEALVVPANILRRQGEIYKMQWYYIFGILGFHMNKYSRSEPAHMSRDPVKCITIQFQLQRAPLYSIVPLPHRPTVRYQLVTNEQLWWGMIFLPTSSFYLQNQQE